MNGYTATGNGHVARRFSRPPTFVRLALLVRPWWRGVVLNLTAALLNQGSGIALAMVSALVVARVATGDRADELPPYLAALAGLAIAKAAFTWLDMWFAHNVADGMLVWLRSSAYNALEPLAPAYTLQRRSGDVVSTATADSETIELFFAHTLVPLIVMILVPTALLMGLAYACCLCKTASCPSTPGVAKRTWPRLVCGKRLTRCWRSKPTLGPLTIRAHCCWQIPAPTACRGERIHAMTRGMRRTVAWRPAPIGARRPVTGLAPNQRGPRCTALAWGKRVGSATSTGETDPRFSRTSWLPDAARCARAVRPHGPMANGVHGVLEVSCRADDCRLRTEQGPETLAV